MEKNGFKKIKIFQEKLNFSIRKYKFIFDEFLKGKETTTWECFSCLIWRSTVPNV